MPVRGGGGGGGVGGGWGSWEANSLIPVIFLRRWEELEEFMLTAI